MGFMDQITQPAGESALNGLTPEFFLEHGMIMRVAVVGVTGLKDEIDAIPQQKLLTSSDVRELLPWNQGIQLNLLYVSYLDGEGVEQPLWHVADGEVDFVYGEPHYYTTRERLDQPSIDRGFLRVYNDKQETVRVASLPKDWQTRTPAQRAAWWLEIISRKFGSRSLNEGDTFYAVVTREKGKPGTKYENTTFTHLKKSAKINEAIVEAPWDVPPTISQADLRIVTAAIDAEEAKRRQDKEGTGGGDLPF